MDIDMKLVALVAVLAPLAGSLAAGLFCRVLPRALAAGVTITGVFAAFAASAHLFQAVFAGARFDDVIYTWLVAGDARFSVGFLIDPLSVTMMLIVTFVSLMVHIYTLGYMRDDPGYNRFFSYLSLFTFSMLMLVMANNFMQLFFGWEAVGLVSYLLIGFWYDRPGAIHANLKAFLVNRAGDFGFLLGIALIFTHTGTLGYIDVFAALPDMADKTITLFAGHEWQLVSVIGICLFIGAMGKSAQAPLHVWLPDSMEGPTPISALIHAATMVTAGIFMVSRLSPLFELSDTVLSFIVVIGAVTALFMGFLGCVQNDIKRVVAYSTLSQLGYMTVALGVSAYSVAIFHLMTHAFFKALLFLAAGSVIIGMHHDQDIRRMGGLYKYMPWTWATALIGSLALIGAPFFAGFYSKDAIIEVARLSSLPGASFAAFAVLAGVPVTAFYSFRMFFLVFHGEERFGRTAQSGRLHDAHHGLPPGGKPHETPWVIRLPLLLLAIPSLVAGAWAIRTMLAEDFLGEAIFVDTLRHKALATFVEEFHGAPAMALHALTSAPFWLALLGVLAAWVCTLKKPAFSALLAERFAGLRTVLLEKYYFDKVYEILFAAGARRLGSRLWQWGDTRMIDGFFVNGAARSVVFTATGLRRMQTGYLYHYAFVMIAGLALALAFWLYYF
jgi:NADH-quinone oxidoreductase subunit L